MGIDHEALHAWYNGAVAFAGGASGILQRNGSKSSESARIGAQGLGARTRLPRLIVSPALMSSILSDGKASAGAVAAQGRSWADGKYRGHGGLNDRAAARAIPSAHHHEASCGAASWTCPASTRGRLEADKAVRDNGTPFIGLPQRRVDLLSCQPPLQHGFSLPDYLLSVRLVQKMPAGHLLFSGKPLN